MKGGKNLYIWLEFVTEIMKYNPTGRQAAGRVKKDFESTLIMFIYEQF
jgi:hypothetical protein